VRRRSQLYVPANNPRMILKAAGLDADSVILDLEDAVPPAEKAAARESLGLSVRKAEWGHRELAVRINAAGTSDGDRDVAVVAAEPRIQAVVVPKAESDLSGLARATGKSLIPLIETARGVLRVEDVVRSEGVIAVSYGAGDLATSVGGDVVAYGRNLYVKTLVVIAAAAYGIEAVDRVFFDLKDEDGFRAEALEAKRLGYTGKQVVHPDQVRLANEVFSPSDEEVRWAREIVEAYEAAAREGRGAVRVRDRLVDAVHYRSAKKTLDLAGV
jgi:citrate lyase subunit beta / citryl-CoA lyase